MDFALMGPFAREQSRYGRVTHWQASSRCRTQIAMREEGQLEVPSFWAL